MPVVVDGFSSVASGLVIFVLVVFFCKLALGLVCILLAVVLAAALVVAVFFAAATVVLYYGFLPGDPEVPRPLANLLCRFATP